MEFNQAFENFSIKAVQLAVYHKAVHQLASSEEIRLDQLEKAIAEHNPKYRDFISGVAVTYRSVLDGELKKLGAKANGIDEARKLNFLNHNKHLAWTLVELYEEFEKYLFSVYAIAGYKSTDFWPLGDFGSISLSILGEKEYDWFMRRAKSKKNAPLSILSHFRDRLENFSKQEQHNLLDNNFRFTTTLIEMFRHIAVHNGGCINNKEEFIDTLMKRAGIYQNGKYDRRLVSFVDYFLMDNDGVKTLRLCTVLDKSAEPPFNELDLYKQLAERLIAHTELIHTHLTNHFEKLKNEAT